ncbi:EAL domain-containing protein [Aliikangiella sp. G2MR2-5]|uniref:EAL domain-containing response regulator n=1 Tax=Aliikangiella sp. G2MR2-5 TaxID=2788943 RepID=UPI0018A9DD83|nr:EAL domain-containing response regulator [Aliikangiella sp. G2MR2-5]
MLSYSEISILIVDDSRAICEAIREILRQFGVVNIEVCHNGVDALEVIREKPDFDLIILDLHMPGMDGIECLSNLDKLNFNGSIVLMSGLDSRVLSSAVEAARRYTLNLLGSVSKPFLEVNFRLLLQRLEGTRNFALKSTEGFLKKRQINEGIEKNQLTPYYQPIINIKTGQIDYFESLIRFDMPEKGIIPPHLIIPVAERFNLIEKVTLKIYETSLDEMGDLLQKDVGQKLSVNLSPCLLNNQELPNILEEIAKAKRVPTDAIIFEITETGVLNRNSLTYEVIDRLILKGFKLAMDDFGTGFSNVEQLTSLPFTHLKIDRSFVHGIGNDDISKVIVKSLMSIASALRMEVIAEGVESMLDFETVKAIGCAHIQGFLISKPKPEKEIKRWLAGWRGLINH